MARTEITEDLAKELIIGFGFLEGLWIHAGTNPMGEIAKAFSALLPANMFPNYFYLILTIISLIQIYAVYFYGGVIGLIALILAFLGGIFIGNGSIGILLVMVAFFLGMWAFSTDKKITISDLIEFFQENFSRT